MLNSEQQLLDPETLVGALKSAAEPTRLRILMLLAEGELNVKDLTEILAQSQPRISRHLKMLAEAGLVARFREGSWVYFHVSDRSIEGRLVRRLLETVDRRDATLKRDHERAEALKRERELAAQGYFMTHAETWDQIRSLYVSEDKVEAAMTAALGPGPFASLVDLGTGTGRILELFDGRYQRGLGLDVNQSMLACARSRLKANGNAKAQVRHGDIYRLPVDDASADAVILHQVLHYLSDPAHAIAEAARILTPGGRLLIVDFAPHSLELLRERHAHERLGISREVMAGWLKEAGLGLAMAHDLVPDGEGADNKLTVSLWLATQGEGSPSSKLGKRKRQLEGITR